VRITELQTPALLVDTAALEHNLATMADALPGARLRPHVKAHKCTMLAGRQCELGHPGFTAATIHEVEGLAAAGLVEDLLLANEVLDTHRLGRLMITHNARVTVAVDSEATEIDFFWEGSRSDRADHSKYPSPASATTPIANRYFFHGWRLGTSESKLANALSRNHCASPSGEIGVESGTGRLAAKARSCSAASERVVREEPQITQNLWPGSPWRWQREQKALPSSSFLLLLT